ncbi:Urease accessory protein UreD [Zhongshania aliphaticivorans]|uniref:Urease accessory protein UreD n=1 Tax=Zhongshania aliphaticivorans TaxID=1470434 RepID=A0A5S9PGG0_9GAMM|nr:urease accessory protein UreD [Zhongshania aliphaticivorans]CAA0103115.1 Urease accessory protein UreD [Zhongshania aliphaticivorans]CAA0113714.1 Urease accessory protein UreD [Zhongshania aliphaticivorans]
MTAIAPVSSSLSVSSVEATPRKSWSASIALGFRAGVNRTDLARSLHKGPLRVQRPFYPEGDCCHVYLLHPPGGMVAGDVLEVDLALDGGAQALLTTPSAGKVYRSDLVKTVQAQAVTAQLADGACLEWLPQETIIFEGAEAELCNQFFLQGDAKLCAWDIVVLGRRASGENFKHGRCTQKIEISRNDKLVFKERTEWLGGSRMLDAPWGMNGMSVSGTLVMTLQCDQQLLDDLREGLADLASDKAWQPAEWGISQKREIFLARYLGNSPEQCRKGFVWLWSQLRPVFNARPACAPRIWNT